MAQNFHIAAIKNSLPDVQRPNLWLVEIGIPNGLNFSVPGQEIPTSTSLQIRAYSCSIPNRKLNEIETPWMGMVSTYAGTEDMRGKTVDIGFYEHEDQHVISSLNVWCNNIFDSMDSKNSMGGHGLAGQKYPNGKRGYAYASDIKLRPLGLNGEPLPKMFIYHTAWPTTFPTTDLDYSRSSEAVSYRITFRYDWWELTDS